MGTLNIFSNINFYILIFLSLVYLLVKKNIKVPFSFENNTQIAFLKELDLFFIRNKNVTYVAIILYLLCSSFIFLFFRLQKIGSSTIINIPLSSIDISILFHLVIFLLIIQLYLKIIDILFYSYNLKLHFYLCRKKWYITFNELNRSYYMIISECFLKIMVSLHKKYPNSFYYVFLIRILNFLHNYASRFISYIPIVCVIIGIVYDLHHGILFYSYYILFFYIITRFIKKIRYFFYEKDCLLDDLISQHFYCTDYLKLQVILEENPSSLINSNVDITILNHTTEILTYIQSGFIAHYLVDPLSIKSHKILNSRVKNFYIFLLLVISNIYFIYNFEKYKILISNIPLEIQPIYLLIPLLIVTITSNYKQFTKLFIFLIILQSIIILFIMLKNRIITNPSELLLDWEYFSIKENFSVEEKKEYMKRYFMAISSNTCNDTEYEIIYKQRLMSSIKITDTLSLEELRKVINSLIITLKNTQASNNNDI